MLFCTILLFCARNMFCSGLVLLKTIALQFCILEEIVHDYHRNSLIMNICVIYAVSTVARILNRIWRVHILQGKEEYTCRLEGQ